MKKYIAYGLISNEAGDLMIEDLEVSSIANAEQEWNNTVEYFNETLKHGDSPRTFELLLSVDEVDEEEVDDPTSNDNDLDVEDFDLYEEDDWDNDNYDDWD